MRKKGGTFEKLKMIREMDSIEHKIRVEHFKNFIDSLPYRNHDYLKDNIHKFSIKEIDDLQMLILA